MTRTVSAAEAKTHSSDDLRAARLGAGLASVNGGWLRSRPLVKRIRDIVRSR